jgi:hypothetical protein
MVTRMRPLALALVAAAVVAPVTAAAQRPARDAGVRVSAVRHDTSLPLRSLAALAPRPGGTLVPPPPDNYPPARLVPVPDPALQTATPTEARLRLVHVYEGLGTGYSGFSSGALPPDTVGAAGRTQYVQWVNGALLVIDKDTGATLLGPVPGNTLWAGFGGGCETYDAGDPMVSYDRFADRWVLQQFVGNNTPYGQCIAVSRTSDATGAWNRYAYGFDALNDYPKAGVWSHSYVTTYAMSVQENGPKVCAMDRAAMLAGRAASQQCFQLPIDAGVLLPADADGTRAPAMTADVPVLGIGTDALRLFSLHVDWRDPSASRLDGPRLLPVAPFTWACGPGYDVPLGRNVASCIPEPGEAGAGVPGLDPMSDRPMFRLAWRAFADGHEAMVVNHTVHVAGPAVAGVRWYELRRSGRAPWTVAQQGTFAPSDGNARWMGSVAMDRDGGIAAGYSVSGASTYPGIRIAGRLATDPPGTLSAETVVADGGGSQLPAAALSRWGDYSAMTVDPVDDCTFWYTNEYQPVTGTFDWATRIAAARLPGCGGT